MVTKTPAKRRRRPKPAIVPTSTVPDKARVPGARHMVGYARVSMSDQNNQRQIDALVEYGVAACDVFVDTASGKTMDRPGWFDCWRDLEEGDILVVFSLDRLGRNLEEVIRIERELTQKGVLLKSLKEDVNTATPTGRLMFHIIVAMAQWEREWNMERTMQGLAAARARGVAGGQPKRTSDEKVVEAVQKHGGPLAPGVWGKAAKDLRYAKVTVMRRWDKLQATKREEAQNGPAE